MAQGSAEPVGSVEVPASEHGSGFPPFNAHTFASQLLWLVLIFLALYLLMSRIALPRIGSILEARRQRIQDDLAEAQRFKDASDAAPWAIYGLTLLLFMYVMPRGVVGTIGPWLAPAMQQFRSARRAAK